MKNKRKEKDLLKLKMIQKMKTLERYIKMDLNILRI